MVPFDTNISRSPCLVERKLFILGLVDLKVYAIKYSETIVKYKC